METSCPGVYSRRSGSALHTEQDLGMASIQALSGDIYPQGCKVSICQSRADPCFPKPTAISLSRKKTQQTKTLLFLKKKNPPYPTEPRSTISSHDAHAAPRSCSLPPMHLGISRPPDLHWKVYLLNMTTINTPHFNGQNIFKEVTLLLRNSCGLIEVILPICTGNGGMHSLY